MPLTVREFKQLTTAIGVLPSIHLVGGPAQGPVIPTDAVLQLLLSHCEVPVEMKRTADGTIHFSFKTEE